MPPIHVLNLARAPDRLARIAGLLDRSGLAWRREEACDRLDFTEAALVEAFGRGRLSSAYPATPGDMACSISHRALWARIAEGPADCAIVLEDDACPAPGFAALLSADPGALMRRHGIGVLKLEFWPGPQRSRRAPLGTPLGPAWAGADAPGAGERGPDLFRLRSTFLGTCAYAITREAAGTLLARAQKMQVPVDHFLFSRSAALGFAAVATGFVNPAPVLHDVGTLGSDLRDERVALGLEGRRRRLLRRIRDARAARQEARELRQGKAVRVQMEFSGPQVQPSPTAAG